MKKREPKIVHRLPKHCKRYHLLNSDALFQNESDSQVTTLLRYWALILSISFSSRSLRSDSVLIDSESWNWVWGTTVLFSSVFLSTFVAEAVLTTEDWCIDCSSLVKVAISVLVSMISGSSVLAMLVLGSRLLDIRCDYLIVDLLSTNEFEPAV